MRQSETTRLPSFPCAAYGSGSRRSGGRSRSWLFRRTGFTETGYVKCADDDRNGCNYTWGKKTITGDDGAATLIAVQIQSFSFNQIYKSIGWTQNFYVNGDVFTDEHFCLGEAYASQFFRHCFGGMKNQM